MKQIKNMPPGVRALYLVQSFSTFSYATLYSSLALFLTKQLNLPSVTSHTIVGLFLALNYVMQLFGGVIGGRFLSNRLLFTLALLIEITGLGCLASLEKSLLYWGLSLFLVGCGISLTCYNNMMTHRFTANDPRRENAFIFSYAAMSIGFCAGYIVSGFFDYSNQYQYLFFISLVTDGATLLVLGFNWFTLTDANISITQGQEVKKSILGISLTFLLIPGLFYCFKFAELSNQLILLISCVTFLLIFFLGIKQKQKAIQSRIMAYLLLALISMLFWMLYFTGPISIILFIKNNVERNIGGYTIATQWLLNINPFMIILAAPLLSLLISKLQEKFNFSIPIQFAYAFVALGFSFLTLILGINFSDSNGYTSIFWIILYLVFQGLAELLIAPVGYALIGKIIPAPLQGTLMGSWMLIAGVAASLTHYFSDNMPKTIEASPLLTNTSYLQVFMQLELWAMAGASILFLLAKKISQLMDHSIKVQTKTQSSALDF